MSCDLHRGLICHSRVFSCFSVLMLPSCSHYYSTLIVASTRTILVETKFPENRAYFFYTNVSIMFYDYFSYKHE